MPTQKSRRKRGIALTDQGLHKLQQALRQAEEQEQYGERFTQAELSDRVRLNETTIRKILNQQKVQRSSIQDFFHAFDLTLEDEDIEYPVSSPSRQFTIDESTTDFDSRTLAWQQMCRRMLEDRQQLTSNRLLSFELQRNLLEDNIFVDLALIHQTKADKHGDDVIPEQGSKLYEPTHYSKKDRFQFSQFLKDILSDRKNEKLTIVGEPGSGKTTLLQKIAFWLLDNTNDLVIWVSLGELQDKSLRDYLTDEWLDESMMYADSSIRENFQKQFLKRRIWLLLDGLDEMTEQTRDALSIRGWIAAARVIITCRLNVWQANPQILQGFQTYRMLEFLPNQMDEFIRKWFSTDALAADQLKESLNHPAKKRIKDLVRNPLRLTLLCASWHLRDSTLPETRAELYEQFVDDLYSWKKHIFSTTPEQRDALNAKLGQLALEAIDTDISRFRLNQRLVTKIFGSPGEENLLLTLALKLGWLNEVVPKNWTGS